MAVDFAPDMFVNSHVSRLNQIAQMRVLSKVVQTAVDKKDLMDSERLDQRFLVSERKLHLQAGLQTGQTAAGKAAGYWNTHCYNLLWALCSFFHLYRPLPRLLA